jgi:MoaA/NifB/PqqE/SkfB family radical SAM enzyme
MNEPIVLSEAELERFVAPPPQFLGLEVTQRCNLRCPMCHNHAHTSPATFIGRDMKLDVVDLLAPILRTAREVLLSGGGEPLILPYFIDFVDKCREYNPHIDINFISNGMLLSERRARTMIEKQVNLIEFSLDGTIQYGHVGGGANYDKVKSNLRRLARLKEEYGVEEPRINIAFVAMRDNLCELPDLIEFANEIDAKVYVIPLSPVTEEQRNQNIFRHVDYALRVLNECKVNAQQLGVQFEYKSMIEGLDQTPRNCEMPNSWLWVSFDGELRPCCGGLTTGRNIYERNLAFEEVWNGSDWCRLRWELETGNYNNTCKHCPLAHNTIENQERAIPSGSLIAQLENRICHLESQLEAIQRGKVMRLVRTLDRLMGRR